MMKSQLVTVLAGLVFLLTVSVARADVSAETVYAGHVDKILQVRIIDRASGTKAAIGSGFVVGDDGLVITNYHVVSELINRPGRYRAEYFREDGAVGELTILNVDVIHDLALLRSPDLSGEFFKLAKTPPVKGERLFSFGNPLDLGLTIVEGTYNGLRDKTLNEKIHFTGSINPGMSGGPTLNRDGEVVGVNVSTAGNQVSFLVPVTFVAELLRNRNDHTPPPEKLMQQVKDQLFDNQQHYVDHLFSTPFATFEMGNFRLPGQLAPFLDCWGDTQAKEERLYELAYHYCSSTDDIYLSRDHSTGIIRFRHELYSTTEMGRVRFYGMLEERMARSDLSLDGEEVNLTNYQCTTDFVEHNGLESKVVFCLRGYRKFPGLYDFFMISNTLYSNSESLQSTMVLAGLDYDNGIRLSRSFIESISRKDGNRDE